VAWAKRANSILHHRAQVARARKFLRAHVGEPLSLEAVARAAGASPFHFARLYHAITGETVFATLTRLRVEAGALRLGGREEAVSRIALDVGYQTPSSFNKAFRAALGVSPSQFRQASAGGRRTLVETLRRRAVPPVERPLKISTRPQLCRREPTRFAYVREHGGYAEVAPLAWANLWTRFGLADLSTCEHIGASYDDPQSVAAEALRYDAGVTLPDGVALPRGVAEALLPGGAWASFTYRGPYHFIADAFDQLFRYWVATARPRLRRAPCLEIYRNDPAVVPEKDLLTELLIPVESLP
jgi:AraC family transcriptional regulator